MIDHPNLLRILPMKLFLIFLLAEGLWQQAYTKDIILEDEEEVFISIVVGQSLNVKCNYLGAFNISDIQWKKIINNRWNDEPRNEILMTSQWLNIKKVRSLDEGQYSCSINGFNENETFSEKRRFFLIPNLDIKDDIKVYEPRFQRYISKEDVPLLVYSTLHLNCPFQTALDTVFSWYKNDKLLIERKAIIDKYAFFDNDYSSKSVSFKDAGNYTCVVQNAMGTIQHKFTVVVYEFDTQMDRYFEYPRSLTVNSGDEAHFNCKAFNYIPYRAIEWFYINFINPVDIDIQTMDLSQFKKMMDNESKVKVLRDKLILKNVTIHDAGWYFCSLSGYQNILMAEAKLEVDKVEGLTI